MDKAKVGEAILKTLESEGCLPQTEAVPERPELQAGLNVFVLSVTRYYIGRLVKVDADFLYLDHASWIAETGRFHKAVAEGREALAEVEPYPADRIVRVARGALVEVSDWPHPLPESVK